MYRRQRGRRNRRRVRFCFVPLPRRALQHHRPHSDLPAKEKTGTPTENVAAVSVALPRAHLTFLSLSCFAEITSGRRRR